MRKETTVLAFIGWFLFASVSAAQDALGSRWTPEHANTWYRETGWPVGTNFVPSTAINPIEMWNEQTFDPETIDRELGWAASIGMTSMRVFLHDIPWREDREGFFERVDRYLDIAGSHRISTMFVLFDGVWNPAPQPGKQPEPNPRVHNSGWVQSPGSLILGDPARHDELRPYVQSVIRRYADDHRVLIWDLFNEPDNAMAGKFPETALSRDDKRARAAELLDKAFDWAREINPSQPLTAGVWGGGNWLESDNPVVRTSLERSDIISFHNYTGPQRLKQEIESLQSLGRPLLCTEYMARSAGSTFQNALPLMHEHRVGAYNWGLVDGDSQTIYPWDSWDRKYTDEPDPWFHDVFRRDGTPYDKAETQLIRRLTRESRTTLPAWNTDPRQPADPQTLAAALATHDRAVHVKDGWIRDPFITLADDGHYYLTGTTPRANDPRENENPYNTGLGDQSIVGWEMRAWRSPDLTTWESLDAPFSVEDGVWHDSAKAIRNKDKWRLWAPEIYQHNGRWLITHTSPGPVHGANLSITEGDELAGPFSNPMGTDIGRRHDPSLFEDDDGTWWMVWGATQIAPLKEDFSGFAAEPIRIGPTGDTARMGHEGCLIRKMGGKYVLFGTGWSTGGMRRGSYNLYYATADKITGPYSERRFAGRFLGHGTPFQDKQGRWWCSAFFNANAPPVDRDGIQHRNLDRTALTINEQGVTLVPLDVRVDDGDVFIFAKDPDYGTPGPDEAGALDGYTKSRLKGNVVFVFIDDMGYADLSCFGSEGAETPHIDRLAAEGTRFERFYVNSPICSPSRAAVMTGQYPQRWGMYSFLNHREGNARRGMPNWLDPAAPSLARTLDHAGYHTAHIGKWHLGGQRDVDEAPFITAYGFDTSLTSFEGLGDRILPVFDLKPKPGWTHWPTETNANAGRGTITRAPRAEMSGLFVDRAIEEIETAQASSLPFFINLWLDDVHTPMDPPEDLRGDGSKRAIYEGVLVEMDRQLGRLFERLRQDPQLAENTLVLVASDNGHEPGFGTAGELRGAKTMLYEGGIRSPLIAWWPGRVPAGEVDASTMITGIDLHPSITGLMGLPERPEHRFDGIDMSRALLAGSPAVRPQPVFWSRPVDRPGPNRNPHPDLAMIEMPWKLIVDRDGGRARLYNLAEDPNESNDLAAAHPERAHDMTERTLFWADSID